MYIGKKVLLTFRKYNKVAYKKLNMVSNVETLFCVHRSPGEMTRSAFRRFHELSPVSYCSKF